MCERLSPKLTSLDGAEERVGYESARLLDRMISGRTPPEGPVLVPPAGIIARESTDYFAVEDATVAAALRYISNHISEPIGVEEIARGIAVAPRTLQRRFREQLGRPVVAEVRRLRVAMARRLLTDPKRSVKEIAFQTGFGDAKGLRQVFQRELGLSPSEYRKRNG
jgi:LacI family transcriptional regulator